MRIAVQLIFILFASVLSVFELQGQQSEFTVSGIVRDKMTGEVLIGVNILETNLNKGVATDYNGYFTIKAKLPIELQFSYIGYKQETVSIGERQDTLLAVFLDPTVELEAITVSAKRASTSNVVRMDIKEISLIPSLGGKPDIMKAMQLLPGISTQNEASSLLLVRGGDPGQNLYLFDNVPVIYVNHLGGFFSVFNPDIINNIDLYKAGFPSRYGSKLSSIVDIVQKEGDLSGLKGAINIGLTDVSFLLEGPTKLKNSSFIIAGRKTLIDPLLALASYSLEDNNFILSYGFHDINGKFTWRPNIKNTFNVNMYIGDDYVHYRNHPKLKETTGTHRLSNTWGNILFSAHWKSVISSGKYLSTNISYNRYRYKDRYKHTLPEVTDSSSFKRVQLNSIQDLSLRSEFKSFLTNNYSIETGIQSSLLFYLPYYSSDDRLSKSHKRILSNETALFLDNKILLKENVTLTAGLRLSNYYTRSFNDLSIEPRIQLSAGISKNHRLNVSFMRNRQASHLLFATGNFFMNEVWIPSNTNIRPASAYQYDIGWNADIANMFYTEIQFFYKNMNNLSTYKEGYLSLRGEGDWESKIETGGIGDAVGAEFLIRKTKGRWTGFVGYTLSKATRQYPQINSGEKFLFDFDRRHSLGLSSSYKINDKISISMNWVYQTGLPYTPAIGKQLVPFFDNDSNGDISYYEALIYGDRNSAKMRDYHRLDIGMNYETVTKKGRTAIWSFSLYNAYNRKNAYFYYYNNSKNAEFYYSELGDDPQPLALYQRSFFPVLPTFSYKVIFDGRVQKTGEKSKLNKKLKNWFIHEN